MRRFEQHPGACSSGGIHHREQRLQAERRLTPPDQFPALSLPPRHSRIRTLASLRPMISTSLPWRRYFSVMASSVAMVEASQRCEACSSVDAVILGNFLQSRRSCLAMTGTAGDYGIGFCPIRKERLVLG
jgi:hypothetical protein